MPEYTAESTSKIFQAEHGAVRYHEAGEGPALLMLHGSGPGVTAWANYQGNMPVFAENFRCIVPDFPGYGGSDPYPDDPMGGNVIAIMALLDHLDIDRVHIIGNSLGGIVGSQIAARFPDRVNRFVTIGGVGINIFSPFPGEGLNLLTEFIENPTRERVEQWLRSMVYDQAMITDELIDSRFAQATEPKTFETTRQIYSRASISAIAASRQGEAALASVAHLSSIKAPTLITWGRDDRVTPMDISLLSMRIIPNCELHVFPNCGHWSMIERKTEFESLVSAFLTRAD